MPVPLLSHPIYRATMKRAESILVLHRSEHSSEATESYPSKMDSFHEQNITLSVLMIHRRYPRLAERTSLTPKDDQRPLLYSPTLDSFQLAWTIQPSQPSLLLLRLEEAGACKRPSARSLQISRALLLWIQMTEAPNQDSCAFASVQGPQLRQNLEDLPNGVLGQLGVDRDRIPEAAFSNNRLTEQASGG